MFNIGGGELIVIMLIALIVLGPQRLPDAARQVGKTMGDLRKLSSGFQNEMKSALDTADDPTRVAARRNVLAKEAPATDAAASVVETVNAQASGPARRAPLKAAAAKNGTKAAKPAAAKAPGKKASTTTTARTAGPAPKKATSPAKKKPASPVSKSAPRRTKT